MTDRVVFFGFFAAAAFNILGMLSTTRFFTNDVLMSVDPLFSLGGCLCVCIWGLCYAAQAFSWQTAPAVTAVFALEKLFYAGWWASWLAIHKGELGELAARDAGAASFYATYGSGDALFMVFFAFAAVRGWRTSTAGSPSRP